MDDKEKRNIIDKVAGERNKSGNRRWWNWVIYTLAVLCVIWWLFPSEKINKNISYNQLLTYIESDYIESVMVYEKGRVQAKVRPSKYALVFGNVEDAEIKKGEVNTNILSGEDFQTYLTEINRSRKERGWSDIEIRMERSKDYISYILNLFPILLFLFFFLMMSRGMSGAANGIFSFGSARAQIFDKDKKDKVTFKDVAGLAEAKREVEEIVSFLRQPEKYTNLGGKIPKGALLVGPPGTGKTLLAKAVAGEADVPFFSMSGSDFVEMFVGVGATRVRDLFRQAKEKAPCIIFIDEIDAVGRARGKNAITSSNDEKESTLNQLLTEMDGFNTNSGVIILAATNRVEILDPALLRAGRFDRQIHIDLPDLQERRDIFKVHLKNLKLDSSVDIDFLSKQTPGFSGADIANVCNEAALMAARLDKKSIGKQDFMDAVDRIVGGLERKTKIMTLEEKRSIAYHEAGHATISWLLRWADPLVKVTIVPRGMALGAAWYLPEERQLTNREHILDNLCSLLGGRAAEELFLNQTSTGALNDIERVTKQAYAMVAYYGMSNKLKNLCYYDSSGRQEYGFYRPYSDKTAEIIDSETQLIIAQEMERAKQILTDNAEKHHQIAELLIEREVITSEDVEHILGPRPWKSRGDEIIEENDKKEA